MSVDPVTTDSNSGGSFNRYTYANNSPYKYIDPDGRAPECSWRTQCTLIDYTGGGSSNGSTPKTSSAASSPQSEASPYEAGGQYEVNIMGDPVNPNYPGVGIAQVIAGATAVGAIGAIVGSEIVAARAAGTLIDPNKVAHIFGQSRHNLTGLLNKFGSPEKAFVAIQKAAEAATRSAGTKGVFEITVKIGGSSVTVRGVVVDSVVKIGTAFVK